MNYKQIEGGVTAPKGFVAGAAYAGVKNPDKKSEKPDVAVLFSETECAAAACFTKNKFCAAPVILGREVLKKGKARAIVINSGNANAATGEQGIKDAKAVEEAAEKLLGLGEDEVFVCSTGVIGKRLPYERVIKGVEAIVPHMSREKGGDAAWAIM
ncbi:MAG: bifunctional ornithine acetyltransferase/N-acetylglutamate synthase, partial [Lachnospiraceae bacterium]|nr:bifunctional ornithine acetyltransferase/N-acetylglutamate synthase [Lachnospiraceae bacterium]